jgi:hypothetical protein
MCMAYPGALIDRACPWRWVIKGCELPKEIEVWRSKGFQLGRESPVARDASSAALGSFGEEDIISIPRSTRQAHIRRRDGG